MVGQFKQCIWILVQPPVDLRGSKYGDEMHQSSAGTDLSAPKLNHVELHRPVWPQSLYSIQKYTQQT